MGRILVVLGLTLLPLAAAEEDGRAFAARFEAEVSLRVTLSAAEQEFYARYLETLCELAPGQFVALVDRAPRVQSILIFWRAWDGYFHFIGGSPVSTGKPGRFEYFETQVGVFEHLAENPDYRAEGTRNEYGIRGYGVKGMRVFDFGWVRAPKGWGDGRESAMRFQMHATDPDLLERRVGTPQSKGCIRIPGSLNVFLDRYGILDADYQRVVWEGGKPLVLRPDWNPTPWAGRYLVVVDTTAVWLRPRRGVSR
jgi:hypothetical protein